MFLGKKGILPTVVLVFTLISFGAALYYSSEAVENQKGDVGVVVQDLLALENEHKKNVIYDKYDLKQSINYFINNFIENDLNSDWSDTSLYPSLDEIKEKFAIYLSDNLKGTYDTGFRFSSGSTLVNLINTKEYSLSKTNYNINILGKDEFEFEFGYDFSLLADSIENLKYVVDLCAGDKTCWEEESDFYWEENNNLFKVKIPSGFITDTFGEKEGIALDVTVGFLLDGSVVDSESPIVENSMDLVEEPIIPVCDYSNCGEINTGPFPCLCGDEEMNVDSWCDGEMSFQTSRSCQDLPENPSCYKIDFEGSTAVKYRYDLSFDFWRRNSHILFDIWNGWAEAGSGGNWLYHADHREIGLQLENMDEREGMDYLETYDYGAC
ncbi:hypothetical protein HON86_01355 [Candidatus Woesearchaeota archaeon]|mgnify:CR=1 FL=1|jgi:hypothetical protein|nr:hypothetical protein [Candidatus Woesearchaeota archaeon]